MDAIEQVVAGGRRRRRRHSPEFKAAVVAECSRRGVSIAAVALANGLNANLVRRWVVEQERSGAVVQAAQSKALPPSAVQKTEGFVPVAIETAEADRPDIRIEIRVGENLIALNWPISAAGGSNANTSVTLEWLVAQRL